MAGETIKSDAICLRIRPWSKTSHVVTWLTPNGKVSTIVKGAERSKSAFLGQYDLNYSCEILYYARAKGDVHALRECTATNRRDHIRGNYRLSAFADYCREMIGMVAPTGAECREWSKLLAVALDEANEDDLLRGLLVFDLKLLKLAGLKPDFNRQETKNALFYVDSGTFSIPGKRAIPISAETIDCLKNSGAKKSLRTLLDATRVISVFYTFHLDCALETRRIVLKLVTTFIEQKKEGKNE